MKVSIPRLSQYLFLALFLYLFVMTDYRGSDEISVAVNSFFRANPLVLFSFMLAEKSFIVLLLPGVILTGATVLLGRFFCGWICPLGTMLDLVSGKIRKGRPLLFLQGRVKYLLLVTLLSASLFGVNIAGLLDPIAILVRALTFFFYPLTGHLFREGWGGLYGLLGDRTDLLRPVYDFLRSYVLPFRDSLYPLAFLSLVLFLFVLFLERYEKRNWCKNLCPLGTLLGLLGRFSLFRRIPGRICSDCGDCRHICSTAFDEEIFQEERCTRCMACSAKCSNGRIHFLFKPFFRRAGGPSSPDRGRRLFLTSVASGFVLSKVFPLAYGYDKQMSLRPPGVTAEDRFLKKCVRCGECMKVCLRSALYPAFLQTGLNGIYTPVLVPRMGYCEYNCNLCGQVCPTGAIPALPLEKKQKSIIGVAVLDKDRCLPFAKKMNCIVCEEHCPIPEKAIRFETVHDRDYGGKNVVLKRPFIIEELCNGCGICENKCPLDGRAAIEVLPARQPTR